MGGLSKEFDESLRSCPRLHRHGALSLNYKRRGASAADRGLAPGRWSRGGGSFFADGRHAYGIIIGPQSLLSIMTKIAFVVLYEGQQLGGPV